MTELDFTNGSWIQYVKYNTETQEMIVQTAKKEYACQGVPLEVYESFRDSASKGQFFNANIKGLYVDKWFK